MGQSPVEPLRLVQISPLLLASQSPRKDGMPNGGELGIQWVRILRWSLRRRTTTEEQMYESMLNFAYFIGALIAALILFGSVMSIVGTLRFWKQWDRVDRLCDRRDELYMSFIQDGWIPPEEHRFRGFYNIVNQESALAMAA